MDKQCGNCRYWQENTPSGGEVGLCRKNAPTSPHDTSSPNGFCWGIWPGTTVTDWCGEWQHPLPGPGEVPIASAASIRVWLGANGYYRNASRVRMLIQATIHLRAGNSLSKTLCELPYSHLPGKNREILEHYAREHFPESLGTGASKEVTPPAIASKSQHNDDTGSNG